MFKEGEVREHVSKNRKTLELILASLVIYHVDHGQTVSGTKAAAAQPHPDLITLAIHTSPSSLVIDRSFAKAPLIGMGSRFEPPHENRYLSRESIFYRRIDLSVYQPHGG